MNGPPDAAYKQRVALIGRVSSSIKWLGFFYIHSLSVYLPQSWLCVFFSSRHIFRSPDREVRRP